MRSPIPALLTALVLATSATTALAQNEPAPVNQASEKFVKIDFPGGTMAEYAALLRKEFPDSSIVLMRGSDGFAVPKINAKFNVTGPFGLSSALALACEVQGTLVFKDAETGTTTRVAGELLLETIEPKSVYRILADRLVPTTRGTRTPTTQSSNQGFSDAKVIQVYPVAQLIQDGITMEEMLGTLTVAFELEGGGAPILRYHEPTAILFVKGTHAQIRTIYETVDALDNVASVRRHADTLRARNIALTKEVEELREKAQELREALAARSKDGEAQKADSE